MSPTRSKKLLIIEDDPDQLSIRALLFERRGFECLCAANAEVALCLANQEQIQCVVMDLKLPEESDGLTVVRNLLSMQPSAKIVILTGRAGVELEGRPELSQVAAIVEKGGPTAELFRAVEQACAA